MVIEESAIIESPDPAIYQSFGFEVATNGTEALIAGFNDIDLETWQYYVLLYRKVNSQWVFQQVLEHYEHFYDSYSYPVEFAMRGDRAIVALAGSASEWRRTITGWQKRNSLGDLSEDIELVGNQVRAYVNGTLATTGKSGMLTFKSAAQFKGVRAYQP